MVVEQTNNPNPDYTVYGGTFIGYNPAENGYTADNGEYGSWPIYDNDGGHGWVPKGYKCESTGVNTWTVSAE